MGIDGIGISEVRDYGDKKGHTELTAGVDRKREENVSDVWRHGCALQIDIDLVK